MDNTLSGLQCSLEDLGVSTISMWVRKGVYTVSVHRPKKRSINYAAPSVTNALLGAIEAVKNEQELETE